MLTIIEAGRAVQTDEVRIAGGRVLLSPRGLRETLGWEVHEGQLCNDTMCVAVPSGTVLEREEGIDLAALAAVLDRPLALDLEERAAFLGVAAGERAQALRNLVAPDFTLPDLAGRQHSLSDHQGKKILMVVWGSW